MSTENELMKLLRLFPEENWDYQALSYNPNLSKKFIVANHHKLNMMFITGMYCHEPQFIYEHPKLPWYINILFNVCLNKPHGLDVVRRYKDAIDFNKLCMFNDTVNPDVMDANPDLPWDTDAYMLNLLLSPKKVSKYPKFKWNYEALAKNCNVSTEDYIRYVKLGYDIYDVAGDQMEKSGSIKSLGTSRLSLEFIKKNIHRQVDRIFISDKSYITWEFVKSCPSYVKWDACSLISMMLRDGNHADILDVINHCYGDWYSLNNRQVNAFMGGSLVCYLSGLLPADLILDHDLPWVWDLVMCKKDLQWNVIEQHKLYKRANPSANPNITAEIVERNPQIDWDFKLLSNNRFHYKRDV